MADLSPELASRIQALEASYADNPGRYFVALAGAWREAGDIARAEEILRENLKRFAGLSPHVLLGRCLADRGAIQEAENEFHYVLSLDPQNLIALRTMAEMAAAGGRRGEAERWYNDLLAVDPMNVEARSALAQLARAASAAAAAPAAPEDAGAASDGDEFGMIDLSAPDASPADASGAAAEEPGEWGDLTLEEEAAAAQATGEAGREFDAFGFGSVDLDAEASAPAGGDEARQDVGASAAGDAGTPPPLPAGDDASLGSLDDALLDAPLAGADLPLLDAEDGGAEDEELVSAVSRPGAGFGFGEPSAAAFDEPAAAFDEEDGHDVDPEMVTETMAELYASQGLHAQAVEMYRELIARRGEEPGLVRRLGELEAGLAVRESAPFADAAGAGEDAEAEPAPDWLESVDAFARGGGEQPLPDAGLDDGLPELELAPGWEAEAAAAQADPVTEHGAAAAAGAADSFADSFASGFDGEAGAAAGTVSPESGRQAWEAPALAETEPVGFDILVVEDEDGAEVPASPEVVADVSADWAIAAAPLGEDEREAAAGAASALEAVPAAAGRTMRGYFDALLAWQPGQAAAPTYEVSAEGGSIVIEPAAPADESPVPPSGGAGGDAAPPLDLSIPEPSSPGSALPAAGALEPEGPAPREDEPWGATPEDEPWSAAAPGESVPQASSIPAPEALPMLELEEPWAEAPAAPSPPAEQGAFILAEDEPGAPAAEQEEPLPWEVPAEPTHPAEPAAADAGGGFSFEDFFSGAPSGPAPSEPEAAAPEPEPEPEVERRPEPPAAPAFTPSFAEPAPPPAAPAPQAPAAPAAEPQEGEDEDLESFQAWLQSLKR